VPARERVNCKGRWNQTVRATGEEEEGNYISPYPKEGSFSEQKTSNRKKEKGAEKRAAGTFFLGKKRRKK